MSYDKVKQAAYMKRRYDTQRAFFICLLGDQCVRCKSKQRLEIDHKDPELKTVNLGLLATKRTVVAAVKELVTKCQILCHQCHKTKSAKEFVTRFRKPIKHGTMYAWMKLGCACHECSQSKWAWHDKRNAARRRGPKANTTNRPGPSEPVSDETQRPSRLTRD